jgi:hypothetical protein
MNAKYLSLEAKAACKALKFMPREFEIVNADRPAIASGPDDPEYVVLRVWNNKSTVKLTNHDLAYAANHLRK